MFELVNCAFEADACTCPTAWWGVCPPPCPVHTPSLHGYSGTGITITPVPIHVTVPKPTTAKGWECPRCSRINAPNTPWCCKEK